MDYTTTGFQLNSTLDKEKINTSDGLSTNMKRIAINIKGVPYGQKKAKGNKKGPREWSEEIIAQTKSLSKVDGQCMLRATFKLPENKYPSDLPYGPDLDNLLKSFLDALNETIFNNVEGHDSCVTILEVAKIRVAKEKDTGVYLEIIPLVTGSK